MASLVIEILTMAYRYPMAIRTFFYPTNQLPSVVAQTGQSPDQRLAVSRTKLAEGCAGLIPESGPMNQSISPRNAWRGVRLKRLKVQYPEKSLPK